MRYSVYSKTLTLAQVESTCKRVGGQDINVRPLVKQVFCDLTEEQVATLSQTPDILVKEIRTTRLSQVSVPVREIEAAVEVSPATEGLHMADIFTDFRGSFDPPLIGAGLTVAVLDSGIRVTHESLKGKVVHEVNFSDSDTAEDEYGHGTSVAYLLAGGAQGSTNTGVSPGASLMNIKVLNDNGEGTDEMLISGIDEVCRLVTLARRDLKWPTHPDYPNVINISAGAEDDGDYDNAVRVACRVAVEEYGLQVIAAAGNSGPNPSTILIPAVDEAVVAVGGLYSDHFEIWGESSRGPTEEGFTKPDFVVWATSIHVADKDSDTDYTVKSGTSFSAPILSGVIGLIWELGRRNFGEQWVVTWYDVEGVAEAICVKPEGSPYTKDTTYGWGMPAVSAMIRGAQPTGAQAFNVMQFLPLILVFGMMGIVMK
jgi:serine protease AprX